MSYSVTVCHVQWLYVMYTVWMSRAVTECDIGIQWLDVTYSDWMSHTVTGCHIKWLLVTYSDWMSRAVTACHIQWLDVTCSDWMSHRVTGCHVQWLDVTYSDWMSHTVSGCHVQFYVTACDTQTHLIAFNFPRKLRAIRWVSVSRAVTSSYCTWHPVTVCLCDIQSLHVTSRQFIWHTVTECDMQSLYVTYSH